MTGDPGGAKPRVLVVDDEEENLDLVRRILRGTFDLVCVESPEEALVALERDRFDLVLADQRMPRITGVEVLEAARVRQPHARRVIVSGYTDAVDMLAAINQCRIHRFVMKPFTPEELLVCAQALTSTATRRSSVAAIVDRDRQRGAALAEALREHGQLDKVAAMAQLEPGADADLIVFVDPAPHQIGSALAALGEQRDSTLIAAMPPGNPSDAAACLRAGADDVVWLPIDEEELVLRYRMSVAKRDAVREARRLREQLLSQERTHNIVGHSTPMRVLFDRIRRIAPTGSTVLILGETGSGKELVARAIHDASPRSAAAFVSVNLSALPETLIESELFGHEAGAFTGATGSRQGRLEAAQGGTLFLDEIGDLPLSVQVKLLRVFQERQFERIGSNRSRSVDFALVCATHRDLGELVARGQFREDLYFRLKVMTLHVPPLRARASDIPILAEHFVQLFSARMGRRGLTLGPEAVDELCAHEWPGNVRELEHMIEQAVVLANDDEILKTTLTRERAGATSYRAVVVEALQRQRGLDDVLREVEREILLETMQACGFNQTVAAQRLKLPRQTLQSRLRKLQRDE